MTKFIPYGKSDFIKVKGFLMYNYDFDEKLDPLLLASIHAVSANLSRSGLSDSGWQPKDPVWELVVLYAGSPDQLQAAFPDYEFTFLLSNYAIVQLGTDEISVLASSANIIYIEYPRRVYYETLSARRASCITQLQRNFSTASNSDFPPRNESGTPSDLSGQGTFLCVIDSGIDYTHPDFCNADGTTRIAALWDQTIAPDPSRGFSSPPGYSLGTLFTEEQINAALSAPDPATRMQLCPSIDSSGHGTHVTGIAAGNGMSSNGMNRGVAYEAALLIVKLGSPDPLGFPSTTQLMQAVDFAVRYATVRNLPLTVNLSFGNTYGSHSGTSLLETYLDSVARLARICIVAGSGNEGNSAGHTGGFLQTFERRTIEFAIADYEQTLSIQLWKNYWDEMRLELLSPGRPYTISVPTAPGSQQYTIEDTHLLIYTGQPSPYRLYQEIYIDFLPNHTYLTSGLWSLTLVAGNVTNGIYDLWMPASAARGPDTRFLTPTPEITLTIPSTASRVITVGAYDSRSNTYAPFSGRGYTWNTNQVKPDLVAPGVDIISTAPGGIYESRSGTSMAAPFVSGSCCLMMEWGIIRGNDTFLYGEKMKAYLIRGAKRLPFVKEYPDPRVGWGALCVADSIPT